MLHFPINVYPHLPNYIITSDCVACLPARPCVCFASASLTACLRWPQDAKAWPWPMPSRRSCLFVCMHATVHVKAQQPPLTNESAALRGSRRGLADLWQSMPEERCFHVNPLSYKLTTLGEFALRGWYNATHCHVICTMFGNLTNVMFQRTGNAHQSQGYATFTQHDGWLRQPPLGYCGQNGMGMRKRGGTGWAKLP